MHSTNILDKKWIYLGSSYKNSLLYKLFGEVMWKNIFKSTNKKNCWLKTLHQIINYIYETQCFISSSIYWHLLNHYDISYTRLIQICKWKVQTCLTESYHQVGYHGIINFVFINHSWLPFSNYVTEENQLSLYEWQGNKFWNHNRWNYRRLWLACYSYIIIYTGCSGILLSVLFITTIRTSKSNLQHMTMSYQYPNASHSGKTVLEKILLPQWRFLARSPARK